MYPLLATCANKSGDESHCIETGRTGIEEMWSVVSKCGRAGGRMGGMPRFAGQADQSWSEGRIE